MLNCFHFSEDKSIPILIINVNEYSDWIEKQRPYVKNLLRSIHFQPKSGNYHLLTDELGNFECVIACIEKKSYWDIGNLSYLLPEGTYQFDDQLDETTLRNVLLTYGLGAYQFTKYKKPTRLPAKVRVNSTDNDVINLIESIYLVRDCINTPTDDLGPSEFSKLVSHIAKEYGATFTEMVGEELLRNRFMGIHTVGRASDDPPRLLDVTWGNPTHPKITLVGKGVCFDTGGLNIKSAPYMQLMKKDMGGAAHVVGLMRMIMQAKLPLRLRVLIPVVENAISGNAYRPGDVIKSRNGMTIEVGNTDAEGRIVLADALTEALSDQPDLLIDIATLTGSARIALGMDVPVLFSNQKKIASDIIQIGNEIFDPLWELPLYEPYREHISSSIADINNDSSEATGGAITAALFLKEFISPHTPWVHIDMMAWNLRSRPGRPQGGEAMALRTLFFFLKKHFTV